MLGMSIFKVSLNARLLVVVQLIRSVKPNCANYILDDIASISAK